MIGSLYCFLCISPLCSSFLTFLSKTQLFHKLVIIPTLDRSFSPPFLHFINKRLPSHIFKFKRIGPHCFVSILKIIGRWFEITFWRTSLLIIFPTVASYLGKNKNLFGTNRIGYKVRLSETFTCTKTYFQPYLPYKGVKILHTSLFSSSTWF